MLSSLRERLNRIGYNPDDTEEQRTTKRLYVVGSIYVGLGVSLWSLLLFWKGEPLAGAVWLAWGLLHFPEIALVHRQKTINPVTFFIHVISLITVPFVLSLLLGSFIWTAYPIYASTALLLVLMVKPEGLRFWSILYVSAVVAGLLIEPRLNLSARLDTGFILFWFASGTLLGGFAAIFSTYYLLSQRDQARRQLELEQKKSEQLLLNILPADIAEKLKEKGNSDSTSNVIAQTHPSASILFADVVGFTPMTVAMSAEEVVTLLNSVFSHFDLLVEKHQVEKIKTIGDCYMIAAGVPRPRENHAIVLARLALEMRQFVRANAFCGHKLSFRFGINSGPVVAGVIGRNKFIYDLWGNTVNVASRMESQGQDNVVQVTSGTYEFIKDNFDCQFNGTIPVKGIGEMPVWHILNEK